MQLTVVVVRCAAVDAGAGDDEARDWLDSDDLERLNWLLPAHVDAAMVLRRLTGPVGRQWPCLAARTAGTISP